jgi:DNA gyrase/topoisomerase IV subunit A
MDQKLRTLYKEYGQYSNYRNFPLDIDGLKPVERRVLLTAYKIARTKLTKCLKVSSYTNGNYHPHGECYGTIVQLVRQGFLEGQGNFGTNVGVEPTGAAAPRYTECKLNSRTENLAFKYVNYVNWVPTEMDDKEPEFLPTMYPLCLLGNEPTQGIGFGFKTYIPCYSPDDLHKRLLWLLGIRKRKPIIAPITDCIITSTNEELDKLLTTGKAKINVEGVIDVNPRNNTVILRSWPPGKRFESFLNKFSKELSDGLIGFRDASVTETEIIFQVLRERNRDKIFKDFVDVLKESIKGNISYEIQAIDHAENKVSLKSIDEMLLNTYKMFQHVNSVRLEKEKTRILENIEELIALETIREPLSTCIKNEHSIQQTIEGINELYKIPKETIEMLIKKYSISKLLTLNTDTTALKNQLRNFEETLKNISEFVLEQYGGFI